MPRSRSVLFAFILAPSAHSVQAQGPGIQRDILWTAAPRGLEEAYLEIWRMGPDGSNPRAVGGVVGNFAVWSPDGTRILFVADREGREGVFEMAADGSDVHPVGPEDASYPEWSPDGSQILFSAPGSSSLDLYVMDADGTRIRQLTSDTNLDHCGHWAPDGASVLVSATDGDEHRLVSIELGTGIARNVLPDSMEGQCGVWSPDGTKIAFASGPDGHLPSVDELMRMPDPVLDIWLLDVATAAATRLTDNGTVTNYPRWSRDGRRILFQCSRNEATGAPGGDSGSPTEMTYLRLEICTMAADGSDVRQLTDNLFFDAHPNW